MGQNPNILLKKPAVTIVGSRKPTPYGREVTTKIARELAARDVVIVSGLALGIDSIAHQACLDVDGTTIAVLPCGPDTIYPSSHRHIAQRILDKDGAILTEYNEGMEARRENFIARNRLVSGLGDVVIVTEAAEKSGTLHTINFALEQGKAVMAVPGPITSPLSRGPNNVIKAGALPITDVADILAQLGLDSQKTTINASSPEEYVILQLISQGVSDGHKLLTESKLEPQTFNQTLTMLEINGQITPLGNNHWTLG